MLKVQKHRLEKSLRITCVMLGAALTLLAPIRWLNLRPSDFLSYWGGGGDTLIGYAWVHSLVHFNFPIDHEISVDGLNWGYFPILDWSQGLIAAIFDKFLSPGSGLSVVYILSFPACYFLSFAILRRLNIRYSLSIVFALSMSLLPWHFYRLGHLTLATSYGYLAGLLLILRLASRFKAWNKRSLLIDLGLLLVAATSGVYFAAFTMGLLLVYTVWRYLVNDRKPFTIRRELFSVIFFSFIVLLEFLPYKLALGSQSSTSVSGRIPYESVMYGGRLALLFIPSQATNIPILKHLLTFQNGIPADTESGLPSNYGNILSSTAMVVISLVMSYAFIRGRISPRMKHLTSDEQGLWHLLQVLFISSLIFFITYGPNLFVAFFVTPQIRAWNRLTPLILSLALMMLAFLLEHFTRKSSPALGRAKNALVPLLLLLVLMDQFPAPGTARGVIDAGIVRTRLSKEYSMDLQRYLPAGCPIYQTPSVEFPESPPVVDLMDYEHMLPAIIADSFRWSYPTMKNTEDSLLLETLRASSLDALLPRLRDEGYCAIHYDARGYSNNDYFKDLSSQLGDPIVVGFNGFWSLFRL